MGRYKYTQGSSCFESHHNVKEMLLESQKHGILKHHNRGQYSSRDATPNYISGDREVWRGLTACWAEQGSRVRRREGSSVPDRSWRVCMCRCLGERERERVKGWGGGGRAGERCTLLEEQQTLNRAPNSEGPKGAGVSDDSVQRKTKKTASRKEGEFYMRKEKRWSRDTEKNSHPPTNRTTF